MVLQHVNPMLAGRIMQEFQSKTAGKYLQNMPASAGNEILGCMLPSCAADALEVCASVEAAALIRRMDPQVWHIPSPLV
eukprot:7671798-Pyramimonas_sp.AAC.1